MKLRLRGLLYVRVVAALVLIAAVVGLAPGAGPVPAGARASGDAEKVSGSASLLPTAKAAISATLGRDDSAYRVVGLDDGLQIDNLKYGLKAGFAPGGAQGLAPAASLNQTGKVTASDGAPSDFFGSSISIHGDTVVVGAGLADVGGQANQGAAYVFVKPIQGWSGNLTQVAKLVASDGAALDNFGGAVSVSGDTVVVGARAATVGANAAQGAAYVFVKPSTGWAGTLTESAKLIASDGAAGDIFAIGVGIDGDTVVAGALSHSPGVNLGQGAAYVFVKPAGGWSGTLTQSAKLIASDGAAGDGMGFVAVSFDTVVAGAPFKTIGANVGQGAAYVFARPGTGWAGTLTQHAKLIASGGAADDGFGARLAVSGQTIVIGASDADVGASVDQGAAYVFVEPVLGWAGTLTQNAKLIASDGAANDLLSIGAVSVSGDTVAIGAGGADVGGKLDQGAAYVFVKPSTGWAGTLTQSQKLTVAEGAAGDALGGLAVSISGDTVAVGVSGSDVGPGVDQGASYVFIPLRPMLFMPVFFHADGGGW